MLDYHYRYSVDNNTIEKIIGYNTEDWIGLFKSVLANKSLDLNFEFSNFDPVTRIKTLYAILVTKKIPNNSFHEAIVNLFQEIYPLPNLATDSLVLIQIIDYIRPSMYSKRLIQYAINPSYYYMRDVSGEDNLSLHFHLINALSQLDTGSDLQEYLLTLYKSEGRQIPEYYQVTLRCLYKYASEEEFSSFFNDVFGEMIETDIYRLVKFTLVESILSTKSFKKLVELLSSYHRELSEKNKALLHDLIQYLSEWVKRKESKVSNFSYYEEFIEISKVILLSKIDILIPNKTLEFTYGGTRSYAIGTKNELRFPKTKPSSPANNFFKNLKRTDSVNKRRSFIRKNAPLVSKSYEINLAQRMSANDYLINEHNPQLRVS